MKALKITLSLLFFFGLFSTVSFAAESFAVTGNESSLSVNEQNHFSTVQNKKMTEKLTFKQKFLAKRFKKLAKKNRTSVLTDDDTVLLVILALLLPPLAVFLLEGLTTNFWIDVILSLFFWLPGIIFALYLILR